MAKFQLWIEGGTLWGQGEQKARLVGTIEGDNFDDAVDKYVESLPPKQNVCWEYEDYRWNWCGRTAYDNEQAARTAYG